MTVADMERIREEDALAPAKGAINGTLLGALVWIALAGLTALMVGAWDATV